MGFDCECMKRILEVSSRIERRGVGEEVLQG